jgi:hypothetical protein
MPRRMRFSAGTWILAQLVVIVGPRSPVPGRRPAAPPTSRPGVRHSEGHAGRCNIERTGAPARGRDPPAPRGSAPPFDVMSPPSKPATTARRSTASNSNSLVLHSVCIGAYLEPEIICSRKTIFSDSQPRCTPSFEKSRLKRSVRVLHARDEKEGGSQ